MDQENNDNTSLKEIVSPVQKREVLDISWASILKIVFAIGIVYLIYMLGSILIWFIFSMIISILFNPAIGFLQKLKIPRIIGAILVYSCIFIILGAFIYALAPMLFSEIHYFSDDLPGYIDKISPYFEGVKIEALKDLENFSGKAEEILLYASANIFTALGIFFGGLLSVFVIFTMAFFLSLEEEGVKQTISLIPPKQYKDKVLEVWQRAQRNISIWFGVRILGCIFIGLSTGITCYVLDIKYAVAFGVFAGIANLVAFVGPLSSTILISLFILITASLPKAIIFVISLWIAQQIESYVLMPILSKRFLKLSPVIILASLLIGANLWGLMGAMLAIPLVGMIFEVAKGILEYRGQHKIEVEQN